jgi:hypothetical protein
VSQTVLPAGLQFSARLKTWRGHLSSAFKKIAHANGRVQIEVGFRNQVENGNDLEENVERRPLEQVSQAKRHANAESRFLPSAKFVKLPVHDATDV